MGVKPGHNLNALLVGTGEFSFADGATSAANALTVGYTDFGNVLAFTPQVENEKLEHFGSYRGVRRKDKTIATQVQLVYQLRLDEWKPEILEILFGSTAGSNHTQGATSGDSGDAIDFTAITWDERKWYDITISGVRQRNLTTVTVATLTEGTDFEVDLTLGRIRFLTTQSTSLVPLVTADAITSADAGYMVGLKPMQNITREGYGRLVIFDQYDSAKVVIDHVDFSCEVSVESAGEIDGQNWSEVTLNVEVTDDVGNILTRKANNDVPDSSTE
jgi:hypothetical protein